MALLKGLASITGGGTSGVGAVGTGSLADYSDPFAGVQLKGLLGNVQKKYQKRRKTDVAAQDAETAAYQAALEKAMYAQLGPQFSQGLDRITNYLAGAGPLADSGARTALARQLYSQLLQRGQGQVLGGVSDLIGNLIRQRQQYRYQSQLLAQQKKAQQTGLGGVLGGVAGAFGGPLLGALGSYYGNKLTGGGGYV